MAIKRYKPTSAARRFMTVHAYDEITETKPERSLIEDTRKSGGRNNQGYITTRFRGGGHKRMYRIVDFKRSRDGVKATIKAIEYDPNRNARIALAVYDTGVKSYILWPKGLKVGDRIESGKACEIAVGNCMELGSIPDGQLVHNIEFQPGKGGQICRAAGTYATILGHDDKYVTLRLSSGEVRKFLPTCRATIGTIGNEDFELRNLGKAGKSRWQGRRPHVRGSAMNPNDHPHGGGEGKCPVGHDAPRSPWGKRTLGVKTRKHKLASNKFIVRRRNGK